MNLLTYLLTYPHRLRIQYLDVYNSVKFMNFKIFFKFSKIQFYVVKVYIEQRLCC